VVFTDDTEVALQSAVALANTAEDPDTLTTLDELDGFVSKWGYTGRRDGDRAELETVRAARPRLRDLFTATTQEAVGLVNELLAEHDATPRLVRHDDQDWHIHAVDDDAPLATRMLVEAAMAMVDVIRADEMSRFSICDDADCQALVIDLSRNRSRRYCSTTCGNRNAVAAYRSRRRGDEDAVDR
jgi:predicted RNA-binding Zn ribbon-like protein